MIRRASVGACVVALLFPFAAFAFPFGGQIGQVINCSNGVIWARIGPPVPGDYIWSYGTRTYRFGPPSHSGQWLLGLTAAPYFCLVSIVPLITYPGINIAMMGSSQ
ncbi:hypothetical protein K8R03_04390 [Candidatus Kaiserbacteria bacterium]|nr:hypothetical protein [Candidatus Kaiserbacteria bacterium]